MTPIGSNTLTISLKATWRCFTGCPGRVSSTSPQAASVAAINNKKTRFFSGLGMDGYRWRGASPMHGLYGVRLGQAEHPARHEGVRRAAWPGTHRSGEPGFLPRRLH